jgi:hypothetical protein
MLESFESGYGEEDSHREVIVELHDPHIFLSANNRPNAAVKQGRVRPTVISISNGRVFQIV